MDDRLTEVGKKIMSLRNLNENIRLSFIMLVGNIDLSDNKIKTFLKFKNNKIAIGFLFRLLTSTAFKYGVPKVYIQQCIDYKKLYKDKPKSKYTITTDGEMMRSKIRMETSYKNLMTATFQLVKEKNSRKEKITKVLEKIADKNN